MKLLILTALVLMVLTGSGCLEKDAPKTVDIEMGYTSSYEFDLSGNNFTNSTNFYLYANKTIQAVSTVVNVSGLDIVVPEDIAKVKADKGPGIKELVVVAGTPSHIDKSPIGPLDTVPFNSTFSKSRGKKIIHIEFTRPLTGYVAYTYEWEYGQFYHILSRNETVNVFLPDGHDTGNFILGSPRPQPDSILQDDRGRTWLVWDNPYPEHRFILVKYYRSSLPGVMSILGLVLIGGGLILFLYFKNQIRKLRQKREFFESGNGKEK